MTHRSRRRGAERAAALAAALLSFSAVAAAQQPPAADSPIQDNSFLVEEAYNQEEGVVQHIQTFQRARNGDWLATFTQEWPVPRETHQLSVTLTAARALPADGGTTGLGDSLLNYRYQLLGDSAAPVAVAPRLSLLLPTGDFRAGRGLGGVGVQALVPVSLVLTRQIVVHGNAGATWVPSARNARGDRAGAVGYNFGASIVWLASSHFNFLTETVWARSEIVDAPHRTESSDLFLVNPGARFAIDLRGGLQIVPGISVPIGVGPSRGMRSVFLYLSFEHPFRNVLR